jgi:hypothetical protein
MKVVQVIKTGLRADLIWVDTSGCTINFKGIIVNEVRVNLTLITLRNFL